MLSNMDEVTQPVVPVYTLGLACLVGPILHARTKQSTTAKTYINTLKFQIFFFLV